MKYSITKDGQDAKHLCIIDEKTKTVSTIEDGLVFDFSGLNGWTFKTGSDCTFDTGAGCIFKTGWDCKFKTGSCCTFTTAEGCTFTCKRECVIIRRDLLEIIQPAPDVTIKLNECKIKGWAEVI